MGKVRKVTKITNVMDEEEALRLDDMFRRSLREEGVEEGIEIGIEKGIERGRQASISKVIMSMIQSNFDDITISNITGKSIKEIREIAKNI